MDPAELDKGALTTQQRIDSAIKMTAPGTALRVALDMIIAGHLGALICVGDTQNVLAAGDDGFAMDVSFTANRLFELCKMDGAVIVDKDLTKILRANYHLNPDPSLPTTETGTRHRTAARMSLLTKAMVISVSERRSVVNVYVNGRGFQLRPVAEIMSTVNQLTAAMQNTRSQLDRSLQHLTSLELDNFVTLGDITNIFYLFEVLMSAGDELDRCIVQLGTSGRVTEMQREEFLGEMANPQLRSPKVVARILGYDDYGEDTIMTPLGLRTLSRVSVVREGMADKIVDEYGSLQEILEAVEDDSSKLGEIGVKSPDALANSLHRMWGQSE